MFLPLTPSLPPAKAAQESKEKERAERDADKGKKMGAYEKIKKQKTSTCAIA